MKLKYILYSVTIGAVLTGCNDSFLERAPQEIVDQTYWNTVQDLESYANAFYDILPGGVTNAGDTGADDQVPNSVNTYNWGMYTVPAENGSWSKSNWSNIRMINYFMTHYGTVTGSEDQINRYVGEMRFFRALEYFAKVRTFGDVPWLDRDLNVDSPELYGPRTPRNEVIQHIIEDLDFAIQWLPEGRVSSADNRLTQDVALHLKARVCLYEGTYYKYHTELGLQSESQALLQQAVDASDQLIESGRYDIYSTGDYEHDYYNLFMLDDKSNLEEAVLYIDYAEPLRRHNAARGGMESNAGFSKDFVDRILYADGLPKALTSYPTGDETLAEELANRDPRARQMIMNDAFGSETDPAYSPVGNDNNYIRQWCQTGYQNFKYVSQSQFNLGNTMQTYDGIAYRYAETLLINAEAKAELDIITQADLDRTINKLRDRVNMPHLTVEVGFTDPNWPAAFGDISPLLQEIRRERSIELAGEGFRWDDICRWKAGELLNNVMTYVGKKVSADSEQAQQGLRSEQGYYIVYPNYTNPNLSFQSGMSRTWDDKLYLEPIPSGEIQRNPQLTQNPGW